jgi:hypothetical protein
LVLPIRIRLSFCAGFPYAEDCFLFISCGSRLLRCRPVVERILLPPRYRYSPPLELLAEAYAFCNREHVDSRFLSEALGVSESFGEAAQHPRDRLRGANGVGSFFKGA